VHLWSKILCQSRLKAAICFPSRFVRRSTGVGPGAGRRVPLPIRPSAACHENGHPRVRPDHPVENQIDNRCTQMHADKGKEERLGSSATSPKKSWKIRVAILNPDHQCGDAWPGAYGEHGDHSRCFFISPNTPSSARISPQHAGVAGYHALDRAADILLVPGRRRVPSCASPSCFRLRPRVAIWARNPLYCWLIFNSGLLRGMRPEGSGLCDPCPPAG
jgi:hypothetical protein